MKIAKVNYVHALLMTHMPDLTAGLRHLDDPRTALALCAGAHRMLKECRDRDAAGATAPLVAKRKLNLTFEQDAALMRLRQELGWPWYVVLNAALLAVRLDGTCPTASAARMTLPEWLSDLIGPHQGADIAAAQ